MTIIRHKLHEKQDVLENEILVSEIQTGTYAVPHVAGPDVFCFV